MWLQLLLLQLLVLRLLWLPQQPELLWLLLLLFTLFALLLRLLPNEPDVSLRWLLRLRLVRLLWSGMLRLLLLSGVRRSGVCLLWLLLLLQRCDHRSGTGRP